MNSYLRLAMFVGAASASAGVFAQEDVAETPLDDIKHVMKVSANQLSKKVTAKPTQQPQQDAVDKLDALIAKLEEERKQLAGRGQSTANPTTPANASNIMSGPGGMGDLHGVRDQGNRWGELPAHERDRILQSLTEGFPPHYQAILEAYYKRLAVEKPADETDPPAGSKPPAMKAGKSKPMSSTPARPKSPAMKAGK
jgi:hypothetical protein